MNKTRLATLGLIFITFLSAIQYIFLLNVPDSVSTFAFLCITNLIGLILLSLTQLKKLFSIRKKAFLKGLLFAVELTGFNFFLLLGSHNLDSVVISSIVSMYFIFVTPILLLLKKKVNFLSGIAAVVAVIALLLMFGADTDALFSSVEVIYLVIADLFFAAYVVSISILGADEDSVHLTLSQMLGGVVLSLVGWVIESALGHGSFSLPTDMKFWISALFIGVLIRAVYGILQMICQKHVPAINASLIFSAEIIITLILNPVMSRLLGADYTPATAYQVIGCFLFIIATLIVDDSIMGKLGFEGLEVKQEIDAEGNITERSSVSKKMVSTTITFTMITLMACLVVCLSAISLIRVSTVRNSTNLGEEASSTSAEALTNELEFEMQQLAEDKAKLAEAKLNTYSSATKFAASYASSLLANPEEYPETEVEPPRPINDGIWVMQRCLANEDMVYADVEVENKLLGNMIDALEPIVKNNPNIATTYLGTEAGLLLSYDTGSGVGDEFLETYYEFREADWYINAKQLDKSEGYFFTEAYQDSYGRGLTITCVAPFYTPDGKFYGCVAMDILMSDLNESMVNDGIIDPNVATMLDNTGNVIASKYLDEENADSLNIYDDFEGNQLKEVADTILAEDQGIIKTGEGDDATYVSYATIHSTDWTIGIVSPVYSVLEPANAIRDSIDENTATVIATVVQGIMRVLQDCLILMAVILLAATFIIGKSSRKITDPLKKLESDVQEISRGNLDYRSDVKTDDEIGSLANSFNFMTDSIQQYMSDLKDATAKEERIASELSVATNIQADMLPSDFPAFPEHKEFDIFATMNPAKEVGGDFYDFFLIDDKHLGLVMADVSGKGVPAALFMVIAKTMIKNRALMGGTPGEILADVNNQLCEGNKESLFVTVWLGIVDLTTGVVTETNAGHEYPAIRHKDGSFELRKTKHSPAVAVMEDFPFRDGEFQLQPGDRLFVYTDGCPEATNAFDTLFGNDRMIESLNKHKDETLPDLLHGLREDIDAFVGEAPQFDDVTMLGFDFFGPQA